MRKFAFQELAYAIVVATSYGLIMGYFLVGKISDILIYILWVLLICGHLAGIWLIVHLEERREREEGKSKVAEEKTE